MCSEFANPLTSPELIRNDAKELSSSSLTEEQLRLENAFLKQQVAHLTHEMHLRMESYIRRESQKNENLEERSQRKSWNSPDHVMSNVKEYHSKAMHGIERLNDYIDKLDRDKMRIQSIHLTELQQKRLDKEQQAQQAENWNKKLSEMNKRFEELQERAQILENTNQQLVAENRRLLKKNKIEPEIHELFIKAKRDNMRLKKENESLKHEIST